MLEILHVTNSVTYGDQFKFQQPPNVSRHHEALAAAGIVSRLHDHIRRCLKLPGPITRSHVWAGTVRLRGAEEQMNLVVIKFWHPSPTFGPSDVFAAAFRAQPGIVFPGGSPLSEAQLAVIITLLAEA